jgi:hypothetical protein
VIEVNSTLPKMSASSSVSPTVRETGSTLHLAYFAAGDDSSAVLRFAGIRGWHYGYPNDEGLDSHPLYGYGLEPYEFHMTPVAGHGERAWVATFHDGTFTVYATSVELVTADFSGDPSSAIDSFVGHGLNRALDME